MRRTRILPLSSVGRRHWPSVARMLLGCGILDPPAPHLSHSEGGAVASPPHESQDAEQRMLGALPGVHALGRGPAPGNDYSRHEYHHPAAGWGAARSVGKVL